MQKERLSWQEMKVRYPNEWLLIIDYETDESGHLVSGVVERNSPDVDEVARPPALGQPTAFRFTGESSFKGLRSHANRNLL